MAQGDLSLPFHMNKIMFDPNEQVKIKVISQKDWGRVNWKTGTLIDETAEPVVVDAVMIDIHGGSFNGGSPAKQYQYTKYITMKTGYPVFSIDYRLAPHTKFPGNLGDCLQGYLWIAYYAEKYLKLKPKSIIIEGDSAGGNLAMGVTGLTIQKGVRSPDKCLFVYP